MTKKVDLKNPPECCGKKARWVNNGPRLEYWYCGECKTEVKEQKKPTINYGSYEEQVQLIDPPWKKKHGSGTYFISPHTSAVYKAIDYDPTSSEYQLLIIDENGFAIQGYTAWLTEEAMISSGWKLINV